MVPLTAVHLNRQMDACTFSHAQAPKVRNLAQCRNCLENGGPRATALRFFLLEVAQIQILRGNGNPKRGQGLRQSTAKPTRSGFGLFEHLGGPHITKKANQVLSLGWLSRFLLVAVRLTRQEFDDRVSVNRQADVRSRRITGHGGG